MINLYKEWLKEYDCLPIGYILKKEYKHKWLRFHNLPNSKKMPTSCKECSIAVSRNITILKHLLDTNDLILFLVHDNEEKVDKLEFNKFYNDIDLTFETLYEAVDISDKELDDEPYYYNIFAKKFDWDEQIAEILIHETIYEKLSVGRFLFYSPSSKNIFSPYCGGIDLIYGDIKNLNKDKQYFVDWLPT